MNLFAVEEKSALLSPCGAYRYRLSRAWDDTLPRLLWLMLNPSTADASIDDPTIKRCVNFARDWGYGSIAVGNLFALRSTDPDALRHHTEPVGPDNDDHLKALSADPTTGMVVCAWSNWGSLRDRDRVVLRMLTEAGITPRALKVNGTGQPAHPLYLPANLKPNYIWREGWLRLETPAIGHKPGDKTWYYADDMIPIDEERLDTDAGGGEG